MNRTIRGPNPADKLFTPTGPDGVATFTPIAFDQIVVQCKGWVPVRRYMGGEIELNAAHRALSFVLERGMTIGGSFVDDDGSPLAGATILFDGWKSYPDGREMIDTIQQTAKTGPDGRWTFDGLPADVAELKIGTFHPACLGAGPAVTMAAVTDLKPLRDGTWRATLIRGVPVDVAVLGSGGRPVPKARLTYGTVRVNVAIRPLLDTDADGRITLGVPPDTTATLTVTAKGFAPELLHVAVRSDPTDVRVDLKPAATVAGQVVDRSGRGLAGATVTLASWRGLRTIGMADLRTDADGDFAWTAAPIDTVYLDVIADGVGQATQVAVTPGKPAVITIAPPATRPAAAANPERQS